MTEPYRPSNGTDGELFMSRFCDRCKHDAKFRETQDAEDGCPIIVRAFAYLTDEPGYPTEWIEDDQGPRCTAFERIEK